MANGRTLRASVHTRGPAPSERRDVIPPSTALTPAAESPSPAGVLFNSVAEAVAHVGGRVAAGAGMSPLECPHGEAGPEQRAWLRGFVVACVSENLKPSAAARRFHVKPPRAGALWPAVEKLFLEYALSAAMPRAAIAAHLTRPRAAVRIQAHRLGLTAKGERP